MSDKAPRVPHRGLPRRPVTPQSRPPASDTTAENSAAQPQDTGPEAVTEAIPAVVTRKQAPEQTRPVTEENTRPGRRRDKNKSPAGERQRRLCERLALEGSFLDPGEAHHVPEEPPAPGPERPTPARALSSRVITLTLILIVSLFMLFPAITTYVRQQNDLHAIQAEIAEEEATQERLSDELKRLKDPEYLRQQARERIGKSMPGEKQYVVIDEPKKSRPSTTKVKPGEYRQGLPWGDGLWDSVMRSSTP